MILGSEALARFSRLAKGPILDIGSGAGYHAEHLRMFGHKVHTLDNKAPAGTRGDYLSIELDPYNAIHCCHVLEHQRNVGQFLDKIHRELIEGGMLCITVPPLKHEIVGGHISLWNAGVLVYNLVLARFDCSKAWVKTYGYNVSVVVEKRTVKLPRLNMACGDLEQLAPYFPWPMVQGFDGQQDSV